MTLNKRQEGIIKTVLLEKTSVTIVGVGGIGSWAATALTRLGIGEFTLIDDDVVEQHNLASQTYNLEDVGEHKVGALNNQMVLIRRPDIDVSIVEDKFQKNFLHSDIVICGLDSMEARKELWKELDPNRCGLYIDARMGGELMRIYPVDMADEEQRARYERELNADKGIHKEACSARAIVYNTQIIGGMIALLVKKYLTEEDLPYQIIFDLRSLTLVKVNHGTKKTEKAVSQETRRSGEKDSKGEGPIPVSTLREIGRGLELSRQSRDTNEQGVRPEVGLKKLESPLLPPPH